MNNKKNIMAFKIQDNVHVDILVCGGGPAGIAAAMMGAKMGKKVLLIERYGRLGGMAVQAMVGPLMGHVDNLWVDEIVRRLGGRNIDYEFIDLKYADILQEAGAGLLLHTWAIEPLCCASKVQGGRLISKQGTFAVKAKITIDATGDGDIAYRAGAKFEQGRAEGTFGRDDGLVQPMSIMFRVAGVKDQETMEACGGRDYYRFPDGRSWDELTKDANSNGDLPPSVGKVRTYYGLRSYERIINATQINLVDGTKADDLTYAELEGRRQVTPILKFLKQYAPGFQNAYVSGMPAVIGVRETRRIYGCNYLSEQDIFSR